MLTMKQNLNSIQHFLLFSANYTLYVQFLYIELEVN